MLHLSPGPCHQSATLVTSGDPRLANCDLDIWRHPGSGLWLVTSASKSSIWRFEITRDRGVNARLAWCLNSVLNVKAVVAAFNQEKALVGAFSVITNLRIDLRLNLYWWLQERLPLSPPPRIRVQVWRRRIISPATSPAVQFQSQHLTMFGYCYYLQPTSRPRHSEAVALVAAQCCCCSLPRLYCLFVLSLHYPGSRSGGPQQQSCSEGRARTCAGNGRRCPWCSESGECAADGQRQSQLIRW